jgi:hypothetical protein
MCTAFLFLRCVPDVHPYCYVNTFIDITMLKAGWSDPDGATQLTLMSPAAVDDRALFIPTQTGTVVLFPSYVLHAGDPHLGDTSRVSIAFNAGLTPDCMPNSACWA